MHAQSSRVIIIFVQVRASENICSSSEGAEAKGNRGGSKQDETQFTTKNWCFSEFQPSL